MAQIVSDNADLIDAFKARNQLSEAPEVADVFHAVRRIPYGSRGGRDLRTVVEHNEGSCSGKHILLRALLRHSGHQAEIETVRGDFTSRLTVHASMSPDLQGMCRDGGVVDFHQYVVWTGAEGALKLDATWSDGPIQHGVPGNQDWSGSGDTTLALTPDAVLERVEDVPTYKQSLLACLSPEDQRHRLAFLSLLTEWVEGLETMGGEI
ncbi:MAG: hypothetical protein AB8B62_04545 [Roseobacter sp.]